MHAQVGDRITVDGRTVGDRTRTGRVIKVQGSDGGPPFLVRWDGDEDVHLIYPGSDAHIGGKE